MTYIEEYFEWIQKNPNKVGKKVKAIYEKLVKDLHEEKKVSFFNVSTGEQETHTYRFDVEKAHNPINFIERLCRQSIGQWNGKPLSCYYSKRQC